MTTRDNGMLSGEAVACEAVGNAMHAAHFGNLYNEHLVAWQKLWDTSELVIDGDEQIQRAANHSAFSQLQVTRPEYKLVNVGARTFGEHYKGHAFWDTEIYMLPFFTYTQPQTCRSLLLYRYYSLSGARRRSREEGYVGARFPWRSGMVNEKIHRVLDAANGEMDASYEGGEELTAYSIRDFEVGPVPGEDLTGKLEMHVSWGIVAAVRRYYETTRDWNFMEKYGIELVLEIARFAANPKYTVWNEARQSYDTRTIGPNEWGERDINNPNEVGVLNNTYNNVMTALAIYAAIEYCQKLSHNKLEELLKKMGISRDEFDAFVTRGNDIISKITIPYNAGTKLILESEHFLERKPVEHFLNAAVPWYDSKIRNEVLVNLQGAHPCNYQIVRQPDAMMVFILREIFPPEFIQALTAKFGRNIFDDEHLEVNRKFYTPKTSGESSLVFTAVSIYELMSGHRQKAMEAFMTGVRIVGETSRQKIGRQGIATANNGGIYYALIRGFCGLEVNVASYDTDKSLSVSFKLISNLRL